MNAPNPPQIGNQAGGVPFTALREIRLLREIQHRNVVEMMDVYVKGANVCMVLEFLPVLSPALQRAERGHG